MQSIFEFRDNSACKQFYELCKEFDDSIDVDQMVDITTNYTNQRLHKDYNAEMIQPVLDLERKWYDSIRTTYNPDYSVYASKYYLVEVWLCWVNYSGKALFELKRNRENDGNFKKKRQPFPGTDGSVFGSIKTDVKTIIDLGCGFGYSTAAFAEIFPEADVFGTNIENTDQFKIGNKIGKTRGFKVVPEFDFQADLIFASEYFEHFESPIDHLVDVIQKTNPKFMFFANAFGADATGHFDQYLNHGSLMSPSETSKLFNRTLSYYGFKKVETGIWNDRPTFFMRENQAGSLEKFF